MQKFSHCIFKGSKTSFRKMHLRMSQDCPPDGLAAATLRLDITRCSSSRRGGRGEEGEACVCVVEDLKLEEPGELGK